MTVDGRLYSMLFHDHHLLNLLEYDISLNKIQRKGRRMRQAQCPILPLELFPRLKINGRPYDEQK